MTEKLTMTPPRPMTVDDLNDAMAPLRRRITELEAALREAIDTFDVIAMPPSDPNDGINHAKNNVVLAKRGASQARIALGDQ